MTQPPNQPWGQPGEQYPPQQPAPGQWQQPPQWQQPGQWQAPPQQAQQPPAQQPGAPQQWDQSGWDQSGWDQLGPVQPGTAGYAPQPKRRRTPLIIAAAAAVVIAGGGAATYVAVADKGSTGSGGSATPQAAITSIVGDLNKSDVLGVLDHLPPAERDALVNPLKDGLANAERLHVIKPGTNLSNVSGTKFNAQNLTFAPDTVKINDHVQIVQLTGGTVSVNSDLSKVPFTDDFVKTAFPHGLPAQAANSQTVDIAKYISEQNDGAPIRLAAQKVNGKWYPSILYTIADNAAHDAGVDNPGQPIPANGAASAQDAVRQALDAATKQDYQRLIELTSPDEMAVLHDYGSVLLRDAPAPGKAPFTVTNLDVATKSVSGGATRVTLKSITFETGGQQGTLAIDGNCIKISATGQSQTMCAAAAVEQIARSMHKDLTADQKTAIEHLFAALPNLGVDVTRSGGKWYVNPLRSTFDLYNSLASGLQGNDLLTLISLLRNQ